ncbi:transposase [Micromonospora sp. NPDC023814]|uniref:transposase n=1 Tax=Micromonospora sp. NPDC023814 TaxID=3154596 RepID=UPI0033DB117A
MQGRHFRSSTRQRTAHSGDHHESPRLAVVGGGGVRAAADRAGQSRRSVIGRAGGPLAGITRTVLESALDAELDAHLDEAAIDKTTGRRANIRNGHGAKTAQTEVGPV